MSAGSLRVGRQSRRVALAATALVTALYLGIAFAVVAWMTVTLTAQVDSRLARAIAIGSLDPGEAAGPPVPPPGVPQVPTSGTAAGEGGVPPERVAALAGSEPPGGFPFGRERVTWLIAADGTIVSDRDDLPLPVEHSDVRDPLTVTIGETPIRIAGTDREGGRLVVGESMEPVYDAILTVVLGLAIIAPILLLGVFLGSLAIGRRVAMPIEQARQRQLAFTADASHELRTPLSVIEANASLALASERDATWYRAAFERVLGEARRMRGLIEEMLWLARFDAVAEPADRAPVDLGVLVEQAVDRFAAVAEARRLRLEVHVAAPGATVNAPPEWIDRLIGVLLDNACRHAPEGGTVSTTVARADGRVTLTVDDDGPGIPEHRRARIFDRFHRGPDSPGGVGLGLAIADAVVSATGGRWAVGDAPIGGARMSVSWSSREGTAG